MEEERARGGPVAAEKYKRLFGTSEDELHSYFSDKTKEEVVKERTALEKAIATRLDELRSEQKRRA